MVVKYCPFCEGFPYTRDLSMRHCPVCRTKLSAENVEEESLALRSEIATSTVSSEETSKDNANLPENRIPYDSVEEKEFQSSSETHGSNVPIKTREDTKITRPEKSRRECCETPTNRRRGTVTVRGRVSQYSCTDGGGREGGNYRRLLVSKIYQALVYGQRFEDVLHRFTVHSTERQDAFNQVETPVTWVNVHGTIWGGMQIVDNSEVVVTGKYRNGVLMADSVHIVDGGNNSRIRFQHSAGAITAGVLFLLALAFMLFVGFSSENFWGNIGSFLTIWIVFQVILWVLYLIFRLSRLGLLLHMGRGFSFAPLIIITILSFILTLIYISAMGGWAIL